MNEITGKLNELSGKLGREKEVRCLSVVLSGRDGGEEAYYIG